jgi:hypothetical protein
MKKILFTLLLAGFGLTSCGDFLEQLPESNRTSARFYQTRADFYNALVGAYNGLKRRGVYANGSGALMVLQEMVSDNSTFTNTRQPVNSSTFEVDDLLFAKSNTLVQDAWTDLYIGIGRVNPILQRLPGATFAQADKDRFEGEARFLRALYYFHLVRLFGDVPLVTEPIEDPYGANNLPRAPREEVYALIIDDLTRAAGLLPATISAAEAGRASQWAAKTLLGKVYLTRGQYDQALPVLKDVNDNSGRQLMANFAQVFAPTTTFAANTEVIFALQYKSGLLPQGAAAAGTQGGVEQTQGSDMWSNWAPAGSGSLLGPNGGGGGGFNTPTTDLINAFEPGDARKEATLLTSFLSGSTVIPSPYAVKFRQQGAVNNDADVDFPVLRFADVVLMYAEALNETDQPDAALVQLNRTRTRAKLPALAGLDQAALRLAIEQERRVELAFENHRWPDLVRTGRYEAVMSAKGYAVKDFHNLYPVPQRETDLNANLSQNTGY